MKIILTALFSLLMTANSYGDWRHHSSTPQEGYWRGVGCYLEKLGLNRLYSAKAYDSYQDSLSKSYDNHLKRIKTRFEARLLNKKYRDLLHPYKPFNREDYLYMHEYYKTRNIEPGIHYNGNVYRNFQEFKCSKDYKLMIKERDAKELRSEIIADLEREELKENYEREWTRRQLPPYVLERQERVRKLMRLGILDP